MTEVIAFPSGIVLSVRSFSEECKKDRETIANRIRAAGIKSPRKRGGHPVYRLRDLLEVAYVLDDSGKKDPDRLPPFERHAHYKAEREKLELELERGEVVPRIEVEAGHARVAQLVAQWADSLPDVIERDCGVSQIVVAKIERCIDELREQLYERIIGSVDLSTPEDPACV